MWLGSVPAPETEDPDGSLTLAELYEAVGRAAIVAGGEPYINGTYL